MECITLTHISAAENNITYDYHVTPGLEKYFNRNTPFMITYTEQGINLMLDAAPLAVLAVPFVCSVLPIIWLTNSKLILPELDKDFLECIPNVKKGYESMFPESVFAGEVCPEKITETKAQGNGCAALFSGGLDATQTLVSHLDEKPHLISIWGSDIRFDNEKGWKAVHDGISETAQRFQLPDVVIRSSFRVFDNENALDNHFSKQLKDSWWHGVKHALALLGHVAPYVYCKGISTVYIASSNCPADGAVRCASNPTTDNHVRYAGCQVKHDGFEYSRQDKVRNIIDFVNKTGRQITLHACWQSQSGSNCCHCEKCYRTMAGIIAEGADPIRFGFNDSDHTLPDMRSYLVERKVLTTHLATHHWKHIQDGIYRNQDLLKSTKYWKYIKWITKADFYHHETLKMPLLYRIQKRLAEFTFYQTLHNLKERLK